MMRTRSLHRLLGLLLVFSGAPLLHAQQTTSSPVQILVADFNQDGLPDALTLAAPTSKPIVPVQVTVSLGTLPYGTFNAATHAVNFPAACTSFNTSVAALGQLLVGDFNNDGLADLYFACQTGSDGSGLLSGVMLGNGDGTFAAAVTFTASPIYSAVGDFNHDGKLDVVAIQQSPNASGYQLSFFAGNGDGTFATAVSSTFGSSATFSFASYAPQALLASDLNGDGYPDLAVLSIASNPGPVTLGIFGNNKDGTFGAVTSGTTLPSAAVNLATYPTTTASQPITASIYGSTLPDLVLARGGGTNPGVLTVKNTSSASAFSFAAPAFAAVSGTSGVSSLRAGNFTGGALSDLAVSNGTNISILANDGTGTLSSPYATLTLPFAADAYGYTSFAAADANGDGYSDLYTASINSAGATQLSVNLVSGSASATAQPVSLPVGTQALTAAWAGSAYLAGATATGTQTVNGVPSTPVLTSSKNPSNVGDSVTFMVKTSGPTGSTIIPTGAVTLTDGSSMLASGTLDPTGSYTYTTTALTQGTHVLTAAYAGDTYYAASLSTSVSQVVNHSAAVASVLTWPTPAAIPYGTPLSATQLNATAATATGTVIPGVFTYTPAAGTILAAGAQTLSVLFTPTDLASFLTATRTVTINVLQAVPITTLSLTSGGSASTSITTGSVLTLTATVSLAGTPVTRGQVNFCDASAAYCSSVSRIGTAQLTSSGTAVLRFVPAIGTHSYKAVFTGTANTQASSSSASPLAVTGLFPTQTTFTATGSVSGYVLTGTVIGTGNANLGPTGSVSFLDTSNANATVGTAALSKPVAGLGFATVSSATTLENPQSRSAIGDFNGDGILDVATANTAPYENSTANANTISVSLGVGDGTFRTLDAHPKTGVQPSAIVAADFNGDGNLDLATTNAVDGTVSILLGDGKGNFTATATSQTGSSAFGLVSGDFNGDGNVDLAVASPGQLTLLLGNGDGTFTTQTTSFTYGSPAGMATADFNGDGNADLAIQFWGPSYQLVVFLGNGKGSFTSRVALTGATPGYGEEKVIAADFNGDGKADLAVSNYLSNTVSILLGNGDGTFVASLAASATGTQPVDIQAGDFNGDGKLDLAVANSGQTQPSETVLLGNGDGTFTMPALSTGVSAYDALAMGDFNGDGIPDLLATDGSAALHVELTQLTQTATATLSNVTLGGAGSHAVEASYTTDRVFASSVSSPSSLTGLALAPTINWTPAVATIIYGTPLGVQQLNAVAIGAAGAIVPGTFTYQPAAGAVLGAGAQTLNVTFTPSDPTYISATGKATITVTKAAPSLTWATPASIAYGTPLSATQLNAAVTGVAGAALAGTLTYSPAVGVVLAPGTQTLTASFVPTDSTDYNNATGSVKLVVTGVTLTSVTPAMATLGDAAKTVTLTGSGFVAGSVVQVNGSPISSALVSPTSLTAVIPATYFAQVGSISLTVVNAATSSTSAAISFPVVAGTPTVVLTGPTMSPPGTQPTLSFTLTNPYPVPLTATFTLGFTPSVSPAVDDPAIVFANGSRTFTFVVAANSTAVPPIQLQAGTVAGTITIPLTLTAGGANVTPTTLQPVTILIPAAVPTVSTATLTRTGDQLTINLDGFSNTRELTTAIFHFNAVGGANITTPDVTVPVTASFTAWFGSASSTQYGSNFSYSQPFTLSDSAGQVQSVTITLKNGVGDSTIFTVQ